MPCRTATSNTQGKSAHAAAYPERGINAADAFTIAQVAIGLLRQQLPSSVRVHGMMTRGGEAPNAIAARTEGRWYVRAETLAELAEVEPRVMRCFEAGALASGAELTITPESKPYAEFRTDEELLACYERRATAAGRRFSSGPDTMMARASTDMGNVSQALPAIHPYIGIDSLPAVNHQPEFAAATITAAAETAIAQGALALAGTVVDAASQPHLRQRLLAGPRLDTAHHRSRPCPLKPTVPPCAPSMICSAIATFPPTSTTACTPRARWRTFPSAAYPSRGTVTWWSRSPR